MKCDKRGCKEQASTNMLIRDYVNRPIIVMRFCKKHLKELYEKNFFDDGFLKAQKEETERILGIKK